MTHPQIDPALLTAAVVVLVLALGLLLVALLVGVWEWREERLSARHAARVREERLCRHLDSLPTRHYRRGR